MFAPRHTLLCYLLPDIFTSEEGRVQRGIQWKTTFIPGDLGFCRHCVSTHSFFWFFSSNFFLQRHAGGVSHNTSRRGQDAFAG